MQVIPVLDLMGGAVVRARRGDRASYRPIETPLAAGSAPTDVAAGLLALHPFSVLYLADLDGIMLGRPDLDTVDALVAALPGTRLWVDNGIADEGAARAFLAVRPSVRLVIGSETQRDPDLAARLGGGAVLSLDFHGDAYTGPAALLANADLWPADVIAMTLARVGAGAGPDFASLHEIKARAGSGRRVFAAGGVRDEADLVALKAAGIAGALVATALHDGSLSAPALRRLAD